MTLIHNSCIHIEINIDISLAKGSVLHLQQQQQEHNKPVWHNMNPDQQGHARQGWVGHSGYVLLTVKKHYSIVSGKRINKTYPLIDYHKSRSHYETGAIPTCMTRAAGAAILVLTLLPMLTSPSSLVL